jgi:CheY-like chemotaxis protein
MNRLTPHTRATILVVDDDPNFRSILAEVLEDEGCRVVHAEDGECALHILRSVTPDLIVLDLAMPVMDGWQLVAALEQDERLSLIPIAVLSACAAERPLARHRLLQKPVDLPNLLGLLAAVGAAQPALHA